MLHSLKGLENLRKTLNMMYVNVTRKESIFSGLNLGKYPIVIITFTRINVLYV